ncbi:MAG: STAS domain-containing protein [Planctomycetaceae bacterium]|nr:STAS domain-containing protein [Planctomycetaceae bacterium]
MNAIQHYLTTYVAGNTVVVTWLSTPDVLSWDDAIDVSDAVIDTLKQLDSPTLIVDLESIDYANTAFLAMMLRCHKFVANQGGLFVICKPCESVLDILKLMSLDVVWPIFASCEQALACHPI